MHLERRSSGVAKGGLTTGIIGTSLGALALLGNGANLLTGNGWGNNNGNCGNQTVVPVAVPMSYGFGCGYGEWGNGWGSGRSYNGEGCCSEDHYVNRYELELQQKIAEKDSQIALRDANTYGDQKMLEMYKYVDGRFREFEAAFAAQAVNNQKTADDVLRVQANLDCCCDKLSTAIAQEAQARKCNDNLIVNYANSTFYSKLIADITTGTTTTPQRVYNPLDACGCCNSNNNGVN